MPLFLCPDGSLSPLPRRALDDSVLQRKAHHLHGRREAEFVEENEKRKRDNIPHNGQREPE